MFKTQSPADSKLNEIIGGVYEDVILIGSDTCFTSYRSKLIDGLQKSQEGRFEDASEGVLQATSIASIKTWTDKNNMADFCNQEIDSLCNTFKLNLDQQDVMTSLIPVEWAALKCGFYDNGVSDFRKRHGVNLTESLGK